MEAHPAAEIYPMRTDAEIQELADSIKEFGGLRSRIITYEGKVLAGRGRLAAYALLGWEPTPDAFIEYTGSDPWGTAIEDNRQWRPQNNAQKRRNVTALLTNTPEKTDREIARQAGVHHDLVGTVRRELKANGGIRHNTSRQEASGRRARGRRAGTGRPAHTSSRGSSSTASTIPTPRTGLRADATNDNGLTVEYLTSVFNTLNNDSRWAIDETNLSWVRTTHGQVVSIIRQMQRYERDLSSLLTPRSAA